MKFSDIQYRRRDFTKDRWRVFSWIPIPWTDAGTSSWTEWHNESGEATVTLAQSKILDDSMGNSALVIIDRESAGKFKKELQAVIRAGHKADPKKLIRQAIKQQTGCDVVSR
jgi:hypothetical protein